MRENKAVFVKKFCELVRDNTMEYADIIDMTYEKEDSGEEYIYVTYKSNCQRRICVTASSCAAIMLDFLNNINHAEWLPPEKRKYNRIVDKPHWTSNVKEEALDAINRRMTYTKGPNDD